MTREVRLGTLLTRQLLARLGTGAPTPVVLLALTLVREGLSRRAMPVRRGLSSPQIDVVYQAPRQTPIDWTALTSSGRRSRLDIGGTGRNRGILRPRAPADFPTLMATTSTWRFGEDRGGLSTGDFPKRGRSVRDAVVALLADRQRPITVWGPGGGPLTRYV